MEKIFVGYCHSPIGSIKIVANEKYLLSLEFVEKAEGKGSTQKVVAEARKQLKEYFEGKRKEFDLPLKLEGTEFQKKVWRALEKIPYGVVVTYSDVAQMIGRPKAVRAVGLANNKNKLPIVIPCHRVIGKNGKLVGYASGLWRKEWLIEHEAKQITFRAAEQISLYSEYS